MHAVLVTVDAVSQTQTTEDQQPLISTRQTPAPEILNYATQTMHLGFYFVGCRSTYSVTPPLHPPARGCAFSIFSVLAIAELTAHRGVSSSLDVHI